MNNLRICTRIAVLLIVTNNIVFAQSETKEIVHDAEFYVLKAQHGDKWTAEDKDLNAKLAALKKKYGTPPNIIHIMVDDTAAHTDGGDVSGAVATLDDAVANDASGHPSDTESHRRSANPKATDGQGGVG